MIFRITDYVHYGTLDNRERGTVKLALQLMGMPHPVNITLQGDCLQDLAGCLVDFRNPSPGCSLRNLPSSRKTSGAWRGT
ncbi:hypothetical protein PVA48_07085 [Akkermansia sp. JRP_AM1]|uniref:hypothetical protein n=1 Tax=Akkermansia sp. JRP_AM1 TaxID=3414159 RepID=UPI003BFA6C34